MGPANTLYPGSIRYLPGFILALFPGSAEACQGHSPRTCCCWSSHGERINKSKYILVIVKKGMRDADEQSMSVIT